MRREFVRAWFAKAEEDLRAAALILGGEMPSYDIVGFHAQQAEKALKALLVRHQARFDRTHDIGALLAQAETVAPGIQERLAGARELTPYAVDVRYPGEDPIPPLSRGDAAVLLRLAHAVADEVRAMLGTFLDQERRDG